MAVRRLAAILIVCCVCSLTVTGQKRPAPSRTELASGIVLFTSPSYRDVGLNGNSIAILSRDGVLVFDANGTPAASAAVLAEIRALTDRPVRWVVNSHLQSLEKRAADNPALKATLDEDRFFLDPNGCARANGSTRSTSRRSSPATIRRGTRRSSSTSSTGICTACATS